MFGHSVTEGLTQAHARHNTSAFFISALSSQLKTKKGRGMTMEKIPSSVQHEKVKKKKKGGYFGVLFFFKYDDIKILREFSE